MTKALIGLLSLALVGTGGLVAAVGGFDSEPVRGVSIPAAGTDRDTTNGTTTLDTTTDRTTTAGTTTAGGDDISGPCDEVEHANDRCTGAGTEDDNSGRRGGGGDDDDNSGPGSGDDRDDDEDRSGSDSGPG